MGWGGPAEREPWGQAVVQAGSIRVLAWHYLPLNCRQLPSFDGRRAAGRGAEWRLALAARAARTVRCSQLAGAPQELQLLGRVAGDVLGVHGADLLGGRGGAARALQTGGQGQGRRALLRAGATAQRRSTLSCATCMLCFKAMKATTPVQN